MSIMRFNKFFLVIMLLVITFCIIEPVLGINGTVSIAYRGSGGSYIGDTIIFDGKNTVGNTTFIKITGPDLPPGGVPIYDINGNPGSGNPVKVNPDGTWRIAWYTSNIRGVEKMQTARYYVTAADLVHPEISSTTSVLMKKSEFYATLTPNPATLNEYVSLSGSAERGISYVHIDITDCAGKILHSYSSPVSASGYFNYGFHVDMQPGQYFLTVNNPAIRSPIKIILTVASSRIQLDNNITFPVNSDNSNLSIPVNIPASELTPPSPTAVSSGNGSISITSTPPGASVYLDSVLMGKTPVNLGNLNYGSHLIEIKSSGYHPYSLQASVQEGSQITLSTVLVKSSTPIPLSPVTVLVGLFIVGMVALIWKKA